MGTATLLSVSAGKLVFAGMCLGIGFWASKKLTNLADEYLLKLDKRKLEKLTTNYSEV